MTTAEAIYELVNQLPEEQAELVWAFAQFLQQRDQRTGATHHIPVGTLTGLRGIAKLSDKSPTDEELTDDYTHYLLQKYQ